MSISKKTIFAVLFALIVCVSMFPAIAHAQSNDISFKKILNARDLGGFKTADGKTVKSGVILRTGELAYASAGDITKLQNTYKVKRVFDFRYSTDHKYCPDKAIPGATNVNLPTKYKKSPSAKTPKERYKAQKDLSAKKLLKKAIPTFKKVKKDYTYALVMDSYSQKQYEKYFDYLLQNKDANCLLFHCIHGKDRTGVAAYMTLIALGVSEKDAYNDYIATNTYLKAVNPSAYKTGNIGVTGSDLKYAVSKAKKKYGSMSKFLESAYGLDANDINTLKSIYTY